MFRYVAFTSLIVNDFMRAEKFYTDLGLIREANGHRYHLPEGGCILMSNKTQELPENVLGSLAIEVDNLKATLHELQKKEIKCVSSIETPAFYLALIKDSEDNNIVLHESKTIKKEVIAFNKAGQLKKIAYTSYRVKDFDLARKFYKKLGFIEYAVHEKYGYAEYNFPEGGCLAISTNPVMTANYPHSTVVFEVQNLDKLISKFTHTQVVKSVFDMHVCRMFVVKDSEGNAIALHQLKNPKHDNK
ncbi:MAG: hypothetical protein HamCj_20440 [Candidatus Hamiltonella defensa (Ceratovacuna japonica)]|nr:glyoxalase/bleomycin resistance/dioxygenase family protein [Candidatus Hamiltonella defensa]